MARARYDRYSRLVAWLKIILPLLALGILSTLFLVARTIDPAQNIPFADVDIDELTREQRIMRPNYSSVTESGAAISVSAASARPEFTNPQRIRAENIVARIDLPSGERVDIDAEGAVLDSSSSDTTLDGGVVVTTSDGFILRTELLQVNLDSSRVHAPAEIQVDSPLGQLIAGEFTMTGDGGGDAPFLLHFKNRVRLIYDPTE